MAGLETATEIAGRGGIGDAPRAQGIEKDFVVAAQFQVFQAGAATQSVVSEIQHMVGLMIGGMEFKQIQLVVNRVHQSQVAGQQLNGPQAAKGDAPTTLGDFIMDIACRHHGPFARAEKLFVNSSLDAPFAVGQLLAYDGFHSKSFRFGRFGKFGHSSNTLEFTKGFRFFQFS